MPADPPFSPQTASKRREKPEEPARWFPWTSLLLVSGLFFGVYAFLESPREIGRWHLAAANEFWDEAEYAALKGEKTRAAENREKAFAKVEDALKWSPEEPDWILLRAAWRSRSGRSADALADCNALIEKFGERPPLLSVRMGILQELGDHAKALQDAERLDALSLTSGRPPRGESLNNVAYVKAIGKIDLYEALKQADEAVRDAVAEIERNKKKDAAPVNLLVRLWRTQFPLDHTGRDEAAKLQLAMRLDTRGFVAFRLGKYREALADLQPAAETVENQLRQKENGFKKVLKNFPDPRVVENDLAKSKNVVAVVLYHRSLAHDKVHHAAAAERDRKRVFQLIGRPGDEKLF